MEIRLYWNPKFKYPALIVDGEFVPINSFKDVLELEKNYKVSLPDIVIKGSNAVILKLRSDAPQIAKISSIDYYVSNLELPNDLEQYQKEAIMFLLSRKIALICLPTGTGKTRIVLEALKILKQQKQNLKALVIVPQKSLIAQWQNEMKKWSFGFNLQITTIQSLVRKPEKVDEIENLNVLIVDEAHEIIKASIQGSKKSFQILLKLAKKSERLWLLTATPIVNSLERDGYNYLKLFDVRGRSKLLKANDKDTRRSYIREVLKSFIFYRNVQKDLNVLKKTIEVPIKSKEALRLYLNFENKLKALAYKYFEGFLSEKEFKKALFTLIARYLKHGWIYWNGFSRTSNEDELLPNHPKIKKLKEILDKHKDEKVIVFVYHNNAIKMLQRIIKDREFYALYGKTSRNASKIIREFKKSENSVLAISLKAGGLGLDFPEVNTAIFYEYWWTYVAIHQAENRIIRKFADSKEKRIYYLISYIPSVKLEKYSTIDIWMKEKIIEKKVDLDLLLSGEEGAKEKFVDELIDALRK